MGRGLFGRRGAGEADQRTRLEVDEELAFHLEQRVRDYVARGMDEESARLGDLARVRAECTKVVEALCS